MAYASFDGRVFGHGLFWCAIASLPDAAVDNFQLRFAGRTFVEPEVGGVGTGLVRFECKLRCSPRHAAVLPPPGAQQILRVFRKQIPKDVPHVFVTEAAILMLQHLDETCRAGGLMFA
jgi:hypothetical protein